MKGIEAGGDFYDAFDIGEGDWTVALGDVVGKGPDAAALMGMVRHTIRAAAIRERAPARVLATVNAAVARQTTDEQFCTAVAARLRPQGEQVMAWICVAGHPSPHPPRRRLAPVDRGIGCPPRGPRRRPAHRPGDPALPR